jgi:hypothetical protein
VLTVVVGVALSTLVGGAPLRAEPPAPVSFDVVSAMQFYTVPSGICTLTITAEGGTGGGTNPGLGAQITATVAVPPGDELSVLVGGTGAGGGGYGGGGGGGGGGASVVATSARVPLVVAGGGGMGGSGGGGNGGPAGGDGLSANGGGRGGKANGDGGIADGGESAVGAGGGGGVGAGGGGGTASPESGSGTPGSAGGSGSSFIGGGGGAVASWHRGTNAHAYGSIGGAGGGAGVGNSTGGNGGSRAAGGGGGGGGGGIGFGGGGGGGGGAGYGGGGGGVVTEGGGGGSSYVAPGATGVVSGVGAGNGHVTIGYDPSTGQCPGTPAAPGAVTASGRIGAASVSFLPPTDGGEPITSYTVRATDLEEGGSARGGQTATGTGSPITVTGLHGGDEYAFTVVASNADGDGLESAPSEPITTVAAPAAPTAVSATVVGSPAGAASVSFTPPADDGGASITRYTATAANAATPAVGGQQRSGPASPLVVTGLTPGKRYRFTVTAATAAGTSAPSAPSDAVTPVGLQITSPAAATFTVGSPGSFRVRSSQSDGRFLVLGTLPEGVTFTGGGLLAGTPATGTRGTYDLRFVVVRGTATHAQAFTLKVVRP